MALAPYCQGNERRWCRVCVVADTETTTTAAAATDDTEAAAAWKYPFGSCCRIVTYMMLPTGSACVFSLSELSVAAFISVSKSNAM